MSDSAILEKIQDLEAANSSLSERQPRGTGREAMLFARSDEFWARKQTWGDVMRAQTACSVKPAEECNPVPARVLLFALRAVDIAVAGLPKTLSARIVCGAWRVALASRVWELSHLPDGFSRLERFECGFRGEYFPIPDARIAKLMAAVKKHVTSGGGAAPRQLPADAVSAEAKAVVLLVQHPDWTDVDIAKAVGCSRTTLYDWPTFKAARQANRQASIPKGRKDGKTGDTEAYDR